MPQKPPSKRIWFVYNHIPGGHVIVSHVETRTRTRKRGEDTEEVTTSAEQELEGIKKSDFIGLKLKGSDFKKNHVLVFPQGMELPTDPAPTVLDWAYKQGIEPYSTLSPDKGKVPPPQETAELESLREQVKEQLKENQGMKEQIAQLVAGMAKLTEALSSVKAKDSFDPDDVRGKEKNDA